MTKNVAPLDNEGVAQHEIDSDYAKMFDEISGTQGPAYPEDFARDVDLDDDGNEIDGNGDLIQDDPDPDPEPDKDEPDPEPEGNESSDAPDPDDGDKDDGKDSSDDPLAELRQQLADEQARNRLAEHKDKSNRGRLSALTRKVDELTAALEESRKSGGASEEAAPKDIKLPDPDDDEAWQDLEQRYPQFAKKFDARIVSRLKAMGLQLQKPQETEGTPAPEAAKQPMPAEDRAWLAEQERILSQAYPNYRDIGADPFFKEFLHTLTPTQAALAQSNDARDVIHLLRDLYTPYYNKYNPHGQGSDGGDEGGEPAESVASAAAEKAAERKRKVLEDVEVRGKQPRFSPGPDLNQDDGSPDAPGSAYRNLFDKMAKKKAKELNR